MSDNEKRDALERALSDGGGILRCEPAWVARDFLPPGFRLGLKEEEYNVGERGFICERWLASITSADNAIGPSDEGISTIQTGNGERLNLKEALDLAPGLILGEEYAATHNNSLGRLVKIYDFSARIPYHYHQRKEDAAKVGANSKEEAYFFPDGVDRGENPETFFGVHPWIVEQNKMEEMLLPHLVAWDSDLILQHAWAELLVPGDGFHIPSGVLHAPGTAVTIEIQEDSDVFSMLQALVGGKIIPKDLIFKDVTKEDREKYGERIVFQQIDWELSGDRYFYENRHLGQRPVEGVQMDGGEENWIYYNTTSFSGKRLVIEPGKTVTLSENGVYSILVWQGTGTYAGQRVKAGDHMQDELLITHNRAIQSTEVVNDGNEALEIIKFFGPDLNPDCPYNEKHPKE